MKFTRIFAHFYAQNHVLQDFFLGSFLADFMRCRWGMAFLFWMFCSAIAISPEITIIPINLIEKKKRERTFDEILSGKEEPKEEEDFDSLISKKK